MKALRLSALIAFTTLAAGALAGCAPATGASPTPSSGASVPATPTPTQTPSQAVEDPADPGTWIIDETGIGPIDVGGDFAATLSALPSGWTNDPVNCAWSAWWNAPDSRFGMTFVRGTETDTAPIREVSVFSTVESSGPIPAPTTADGFGIGATRAELLAAYPDAQEGAASIGDDTWVKVGGGGDAHIFFEFRDGSDIVWDVTVTAGTEPSYEVCG